MYDHLSLVRRVSQAGTLLLTRLCGLRMGTDDYGNVYYRARRKAANGLERRWVLYAGEPEATMVPPAWYGWLHHLCDQPLPSDPESRYVWQKSHQPNLSGTEVAPLPTAHPLNQIATGGGVVKEVYQSWNPSE